MSDPITKKRLQRFSESSNECDDKEFHEQLETNSSSIHYKSDGNETNDITLQNITTKKSKSRIKALSSSESDHDMKEKNEVNLSNNYDLSRVGDRKKKLKAKFDKLLSKQLKFSNNKSNSDYQSSGEHVSRDSENSDEELYSCKKIKKKLKKTQMLQLPSICDPDTSDDESIIKQNEKSKMKTLRLISPKPVRISAKQAMENMQKIKSEANRMLREKDVSLPYHKPRALSLKDIMSRRKPALAPDGKTLSVKMTAEQLEQYALQLEQRQKEMMELCRSDEEEEECTENKQDKDANDCNHKVINQVENISTTETNSSLINSTTNSSIKPNALKDNFENCIISENCFEDNKDENIVTANDETNNVSNQSKFVFNNENDSQVMELHYDSEKMKSSNLNECIENESTEFLNIFDQAETIRSKDDVFFEHNFNLKDINSIRDSMENNDMCHSTSKQIMEPHSLKKKPTLLGAPGTVIDLDSNDTVNEKKLTGVELLKERYQYFAKLQSLEEQEKDREKKYKPGVQHLKLKQELEQLIAEQRSLEWTKRLENGNVHQEKPNAIQCDDSYIDDIEKLEAKLDHLNDSNISSNESSESSEEVEEDCVIEDKPRKRNPMVDDEAEESDIEQDYVSQNVNLGKKIDEDGVLNETDEDVESSSLESEDESSKSENEILNCNHKKGRILKAFEDSDDEDNPMISEDKNKKENAHMLQISSQKNNLRKYLNNSASQDDELQLAQVHKTSSDDIVVSQDISLDHLNQHIEVLGSQTFSIINSENDPSVKCLEKLVKNKESSCFENEFRSENLYLENFSQNLNSQQESKVLSASQEIGDDVAALCTGKFYDNPLISQSDHDSRSEDKVNSNATQSHEIKDDDKDTSSEKQVNTAKDDKQLLNSILEELNHPQFDSSNQYKYFVNDNTKCNKENMSNMENNRAKKKFTIIDSDDDGNETENIEKQSRKKIKKRKKEKKALQFSDDEDDFGEPTEEIEMPESELDEDPHRIVDYDSEENEVVVELPKSKKKRAAGDFFEQEAELTSEDEWIGSGDEDEVGLDRMEREEGDDEVFQEEKLRSELGQIHMRDVLDQDKREVRLLQELLFEDGDLGDGHRQRKFRWKNADDVDETGATLDEFTETQEEFESEEQWRKQRHEREVFLRKMKGIDNEDIHNTSINRTTIIKANLCSRTMSSLLSDLSENIVETTVADKKPSKDIPSPKKTFPVFQQNYHGSLLSRGKGALARLAAIATPLAADDDNTPKASAATNRGNFVFAALTPDEVEPKVSKRKADTIPASPGNNKKMKTEEKQAHLKSSLFDYL